MTEPRYTIEWTETALGMVERIADPRVRAEIVDRVEALRTAPEQLGKPLTGELDGDRSLRAVGRRYRILYRVERWRVTVLIVAAGRRKAGDRPDIDELARRLPRQRLL